MEKRTRLSYLLISLFILCLILHNVFFVLTNVEEAPLLVVSGVAGILFTISLIVNIFTYIRSGKPHDIWKLGWIGLIGFLGMIPGFGVGFFGMYGFYGFFGFKNASKKTAKK